MTELGTVLDGKYEILKKVGQGGMSIVYLAMDNRLNKQWAVKEIKNDAKKTTRNVTKVFPTRKKALDASPKPLPAKQGQKKVTRQTRNKSGEGNKFKTDGGKQTPHVHDRNHGKKGKTNIHYRVGKKK
jgi:serine/threonine protein kinase